MKIRSNAHTHTTWCDGANTPREMAEAALALGFTDLGFSSHAPTPLDRTCSGMGSEAAYRADIAGLREEYAGRLDIVCGIEKDGLTPIEQGAYSYVIGATHYLEGGGAAYPVDATPERLRRARDELFGGDETALARAFFDKSAGAAERDRPMIAAHFDLITKFNEDGAFFDEESGAYQSAALEAMDRVLAVLEGYGGMVEVNTGAMSRGWRTRPYPADFILRHVAQRGGRVIVGSDSHRADTLDYAFDAALQAVRQAGFTSLAVLRGGRFVDVKLD